MTHVMTGRHGGISGNSDDVTDIPKDISDGQQVTCGDDDDITIYMRHVMTDYDVPRLPVD